MFFDPGTKTGKLHFAQGPQEGSDCIFFKSYFTQGSLVRLMAVALVAPNPPYRYFKARWSSSSSIQTIIIHVISKSNRLVKTFPNRNSRVLVLVLVLCTLNEEVNLSFQASWLRLPLQSNTKCKTAKRAKHVYHLTFTKQQVPWRNYLPAAQAAQAHHLHYQ